MAEIVTTKYVKKPLFVDAVQVTVENMLDIAKWCQGDIRSSSSNEAVDISSDDFNPEACYVYVRVHSPRVPRQTRAYVGDWLLYTERGYKVYTTRAFEEAFELAESNGTVQAVTKQV